MAETIKGTGVVWGCSGKTYTGSLLGTVKPQSARVTRSSDKAEIRDDSGEVVAVVFYNAKKVFNTTVVPSAATIAASITSQDAWAPAPGTLVTLADTSSTIMADAYNVLTATINHSNTDAATVDVELEQFDANEVATAAIS